MAEVAENVGDVGSTLDVAEISLQSTWRPLAIAGQDNISPHLADKQVFQEPQFPHSCSYNSSIVTGLLPARSNDTTIGTCATPVDLTSRIDTRWWHAFFASRHTKQGSRKQMLSSTLPGDTLLASGGT